MSATRDGNIEAAQEKQKKQFLKRKEGFHFTFKNSDAVLHRNMLQKIKMGTKCKTSGLAHIP